MAAQIIDGKAIAASIKADLKAQVAALPSPPGLATVLVGDDPASHTYIRSKHKLCEELGMRSLHQHLPADATQAQVETVIRELAANPAVHGILVQLPLPAHLDEEKVLALVPLEKDVDGFHPVNVGRLAMKGRRPEFVPCTPAGCMRLLERSGVPLRGARAVVVGAEQYCRPAHGLALEPRRRHRHHCAFAVPSVWMKSCVRRTWWWPPSAKPTSFAGISSNRAVASSTWVFNRTESGLVGDVDFESVRQVAGLADARSRRGRTHDHHVDGEYVEGRSKNFKSGNFNRVGLVDPGPQGRHQTLPP